MQWRIALAWTLLFVSCGPVKSGPIEAFPGWKGESFKPSEVFGVPAKQVLPQTGVKQRNDSWAELISWYPRAWIYHNFLSEAECDRILEIARPRMRRSTVVGQGGSSVTDNIRTSYGTFLKRNSDPVLKVVQDRLALWTHINSTHQDLLKSEARIVDAANLLLKRDPNTDMTQLLIIPPSHLSQEDMQVLRYSVAQKYGAHMDSNHDTLPRVATVLIYLRENCTGCETAFPLTMDSDWVDPSSPQRFGPFSGCAKGHVAFAPKKGSALLFYSLQPDGVMDQKSMHTGCPVEAGVKWTATVWMHTHPFHPEWLDRAPEHQVDISPDICKDWHKTCPEWASRGECDKNPDYMKGSEAAVGACRFSCGVCEPCLPNDKACAARNRAAAGFLPLLADEE